MVSPVNPPEEELVARIALKSLGLPVNPILVGTSVFKLDDDLGYGVAVVTLAGPLNTHLVRVDAGGNTSPLFEDRL